MAYDAEGSTTMISPKTRPFTRKGVDSLLYGVNTYWVWFRRGHPPELVFAENLHDAIRFDSRPGRVLPVKWGYGVPLDKIEIWGRMDEWRQRYPCRVIGVNGQYWEGSITLGVLHALKCHDCYYEDDKPEILNGRYPVQIEDAWIFGGAL